MIKKGPILLRNLVYNPGRCFCEKLYLLNGYIVLVFVKSSNQGIYHPGYLLQNSRKFGRVVINLLHPTHLVTLYPKATASGLDRRFYVFEEESYSRKGYVQVKDVFNRSMYRCVLIFSCYGMTFLLIILERENISILCILSAQLVYISWL